MGGVSDRKGVTKGGFAGCGDAHVLEEEKTTIIIIVSRITMEEEGSRQDSGNSATTERQYTQQPSTRPETTVEEEGKKKKKLPVVEFALSSHPLLHFGFAVLSCIRNPRTRGRGNQGRSRSGRLVSSRLFGGCQARHPLALSVEHISDPRMRESH